MENPNIIMNAKAPMSDTGTAMMGIRVARKFWRNTNTTNMTRAIASSNVMMTS